MKYFVVLLFFTFVGNQAWSQTNCERNLNEARADYSNGNLYAIPGKLTDCLENGFSKADKISALRLLTLTYININQQEKARNTFIKLLNIKTDFQVKQNVDPSELYSLYRKIDTDVKYYIGLTFGLNLNDIQLKTSRNMSPLEAFHSAEYTSGLPNPQQVGAQFLYPLTKNWIIGGEIQYQNQKFKYKEIFTHSVDTTTTITYDGNNNGINLNLSIRYMQDYYLWKPFIEFGSVGRFNFAYELNNYISNYSPSVDNEVIENINVYSRRSKFNVGINANLGTMIKLGEYYGEVKFGVSNYFINHLNGQARDEVFTSTIGNAMALKDDDVTNIVYQLSITFNLPFFDFQ
ncbi:hypothetical protein [Marivirga sp.]|uniref:hypothetical protein n=1 Tax=Marivirga sp. TaxID=2018662 RepID=UPI002D7E6644|nr:hypothetical protein [Marivirga sp.]HET8859751.1 hypothetical protein [Marivirga sp.]